MLFKDTVPDADVKKRPIMPKGDDNLWWLGNNEAGRDRGLFQDTVSAFIWKIWENYEESVTFF